MSQNAQYTDAFLLPVPQDKIEDYRAIATLAGQVWRECGALEYREWVGEDLHVKDQVPFPTLVTTKPGETVIIAWITYESREHRDAVNAKVMADPRMADMMNGKEMPFDCARMAYGGFTNLVTA